MRHCDAEGCDHPAEPRGHLCPECWLAYADFLRDQEPDVVAEARAIMERHPKTFAALADDEVEW